MIQELHAGDRQIPASGWNEMRAAVQGITPGQQQYNSSQRNPVYITVKNVTGSDLPAFSVVKLSGATYSRTGETFINQAIAHGVELDGDTPAAATDTVAITQAACAAGEFVKAIVSGATPVMILNGSVYTYSYARAKAGVTNYLEPTNDITNIRLLSCPTATGPSTPQGGYAIIDYTDDRERLLINCDSSNGYASIAKKGAIFKAKRGANGWEVQTNNNAAAKYVLAVCQEDIPDGYSGAYYMPFYTPEQNCGVLPLVDANSGITSGDNIVGHRGIGVIFGANSGFEHAFSNKRLDYMYSHGQYTYCPKFTYKGAAVNLNGSVGITIEGHTYAVAFPALASGYSTAMMAPDVYAGDIITVLVEEANNANYSASVTAIEYPTDFAKGTSIVVEDTMYLGRGWDDDYIPNTNFKYAIKVQGAALT